jgi:hypothetical protein
MVVEITGAAVADEALLPAAFPQPLGPTAKPRNATPAKRRHALASSTRPIDDPTRILSSLARQASAHLLRQPAATQAPRARSIVAMSQIAPQPA